MRCSVRSLWCCIVDSGLGPKRGLWSAGGGVAFAELASGSALSEPLDKLTGRSVLLTTSDQTAAALALVELHGVARRLVLAPPDLDATHLPYVVATAEIDAIVSDRDVEVFRGLGVERVVSCGCTIRPTPVERTATYDTECILFTSGTTGVPKMVVHSLATLSGAIQPVGTLDGRPIWATFYDIRRYGGLQILLRAAIGGGSLVLSTVGEAAGCFLARAKEHGVTHISGTPSHWRRALMSPAARTLAPVYARLSGEIADQAIIEQLQSTFPRTTIAHAFASTEAGVAFEVRDGRPGFPVSFVRQHDSDVALEIKDETLRVRSHRTALRYLGDTPESLLDEDGFVDTGDVVERDGDRYYFVGRRGGIINVGGLKIHPEEVEAVINRHPGVRMSLVTARKNPITGAIVAAEVVLAPDVEATRSPSAAEMTKREILQVCRSALPAHKVPASIRFIPSLPVTPSGKLARRNG